VSKTPPKILLVDDVDFFLEVEQDYLRQTPARIFLASNGRTALELAEQHRPDLIFMDVNMPVMDGLTCCRILKRNPQLREIPVVMVFAPCPEVDESTCRAAGCDEVMNKPVDRKRFLDLGRKFLFAIDRREKRIPCQMTVDFTLGGVSHQGMGLDISAHGLYIGFRSEVRHDDRLRVTFFLPAVSPEKIELTARVAWVNQGFPRPNLAQPQGFGVEFKNIPAATAAIIAEFVARFDSHSQDAG